MKNITLTLIACFFSLTLTAQPWRNSQGFTPGAKIALHHVWGADMGYSLEQTAVIADSIFRHGTYINKRTMNSGVSSDGTINPLTTRVFSVTYLGTTDATLLGGPDGYTAKLFLKQDCGNLDWVFVAPAPAPAPVPVITRQKVTVLDTVHVPIVVKPMVVRLQLCTASYIHGHFQQVFYHDVKEFTLATLPYDGEYIGGKQFVKQIPQTISSPGGITYSDYFWVTAH